MEGIAIFFGGASFGCSSRGPTCGLGVAGASLDADVEIKAVVDQSPQPF